MNLWSQANFANTGLVRASVFDLQSHFQDIKGLTAYLDGGTGSMLFQAAIGGMLTLTYLLSTGFARFKSAVKAKVEKVRSRRSNG